jgi:hypothetical protein
MGCDGVGVSAVPPATAEVTGFSKVWVNASYSKVWVNQLPEPKPHAMRNDGTDISAVPPATAGFSKGERVVWVNASYEAASAPAHAHAPAPPVTPTRSGLVRSVLTLTDGASVRADKSLSVSGPDGRSDSSRSRNFSPNSSAQSLRASTDGVAAAAVPATPLVGNWTAAPEPRASQRCSWEQGDGERPEAAPAPPRYSPQALYEMDLAACVRNNLVGCHAALARVAPPEGGRGAHQLVRCVVHRTRPDSIQPGALSSPRPVCGRPSYSLYLEAGEGGRGGAFLLAARQRVKSKATSYVISSDRWAPLGRGGGHACMRAINSVVAAARGAVVDGRAGSHRHPAT